jgi:hypothetical protein
MTYTRPLYALQSPLSPSLTNCSIYTYTRSAMTRLLDLPFELREIIWLLSHTPSIYVKARKVNHPPFYKFEAKLIYNGPPCKEALRASERAVQLYQKIAISSRKHSPLIIFNPYLCPIYLHCGSAQGCVAFIHTYLSLKVMSIGGPEPGGSLMGRVSASNLSMV